MPYQNFVNNCRKIVGSGANYKSFLEAAKAPAPDKPIIFLKPTSSLITTIEKTILIPKVFDAVNYEVELGVVIGKLCKNVTADTAMDYVAGYCLTLDMTGMQPIVEARTKGLPWALGKSFDTCTPVSRFLERDEIPDPGNVMLWCKINEELVQNCSTNDMVFSIPELIAFISQYMSLQENDLILTGTPSGAGRVTPGDIIECGVADLVKMHFFVEKDK